MKPESLRTQSQGFPAEDILGGRRSKFECLLITSHFRTADYMTYRLEDGEVQSLGSFATPPAGLPYLQFGSTICSQAMLQANEILNKSHDESQRLV